MSIGKNIKRYNDDFYLNFDGNSQYLESIPSNRAIKDTNDWTLSCFVNLDSQTNEEFVTFYNDYVGSQFDGVFIGWQFTGNRVIVIRRESNTEVFIGDTPTNTGKYHEGWIHVIVTYDSANNEFEFFYDTISTEKYSGATGAFGFNESIKIRIGRGSAGASNTYLKGGLRDWCSFDKILTQDEINYIYYNGTIPASCYSSVKHFYPLNQIPIRKEPYTLNYSNFNAPTGLFNTWLSFSKKFIGDSTLEFTMLDGADFQFGVSTIDPPLVGGSNTTTRNTLEYAIGGRDNSTSYSIMESGTFRTGLLTYSPSDVFKIERVGSDIFYSVNNVIIRTVNNANTTDFNITLWVKNSIGFEGNDILEDVKLNGENLIDYIDISPDSLQYHRFFEDKANLFNISSTPQDLKLEGWSDTELGTVVTQGIGTSTAYFDFNDKISIIPTNDYQKGLNFDNTKEQHLQITGLEIFDKIEGYTVLCGFETENVILNQSRTIFSAHGDEGINRQYLIRRRGGTFVNQFPASSPNAGSGINNTNTSSLNVDANNRNFISSHFSPSLYINPYSIDKFGRIQDINCQQDYQDPISAKLSDGAGYGFDEITNPLFYIGRGVAGNENYIKGKLSYFTIIKGKITKEQEKECFNNGLFRSPFGIIDSSKIILDIDLTNPVDNGGILEFIDNSGNCTITIEQNIGAEWTTLEGVKESIY